MKGKKFKTIDLFAGIGGIRLGFEQTGAFETVYANDFDKYCKLTYDLNFEDVPLDVSDIWEAIKKPLPKFDFILAGFPCQAFSIAGYRHGFNDLKGRGNLFFAIAKLIEEYQPKGFLLENVKNLKSHDGGKTFKVITQTLYDLGYHLDVRVLNAMEYGNIPQNRERIYIVGFKEKEYMDKFKFPEKIKLTRKVTDLLDKNVDEKYYYDNKPLGEKLRGYALVEGSVYQWRRKYVRENKKGVCPTLTANMGMGGHNVPIIKDKNGTRKLTPLECSRLMGFDHLKIPSNLSDSNLYKQFGNSVVVPVIKRIAEEMGVALQ